MNLLDEAAVRAKFDGSFTQDWGALRSCIAREGCLDGFPGDTDILKLKAWAEERGLLMDFDLELGGFSSSIRSVTFWNGHQAAGNGDPGQPGTCAEPTAPNAGEAAGGGDSGPAVLVEECRVHNDFDWATVAGAGDGDGEAWDSVSRNTDSALIGRIVEMSN